MHNGRKRGPWFWHVFSLQAGESTMESKRQQRVEKRQTMMEASFLAFLIDSRHL